MTVYLVISAPTIPCIHRVYVGLARTIYIWFTYGNFGREITKYTVIYGVYIRFWPTLCICMVLATLCYRKAVLWQVYLSATEQVELTSCGALGTQH